MMLAAVLGWVLPCQSTPSLLHKWPKGRFGLHAIVGASATRVHQLPPSVRNRRLSPKAAQHQQSLG